MKRITDPDALLLQGAADPTRLEILRQLAGGEGVCACDFTACCDVAQPTVSHHLKVLRESGWVRSERHGTNVWYWLRPDAVARFRAIAGELTPADPAAGQRAAWSGAESSPRSTRYTIAAAAAPTTGPTR